MHKGSAIEHTFLVHKDNITLVQAQRRTFWGKIVSQLDAMSGFLDEGKAMRDPALNSDLHPSRHFLTLEFTLYYVVC